MNPSRTAPGRTVPVRGRRIGRRGSNPRQALGGRPRVTHVFRLDTFSIGAAICLSLVIAQFSAANVAVAAEKVDQPPATGPPSSVPTDTPCDPTIGLRGENSAGPGREALPAPVQSKLTSRGDKPAHAPATVTVLSAQSSASIPTQAPLLTALRDDDGLQVVGQAAAQDDILTFAFDHGTDCPSGSGIRLEMGPTGGVAVYVTQPQGEQPVATITPPWAMDESGRALPTWYGVSGSKLLQSVDARGTNGIVFFDPSYSAIVCNAGFWSDLPGYYLLNIHAVNLGGGVMDDHPYYCPVFSIFYFRNGYWPVWGYEANIYNDFGVVAVRGDGNCSPPALPTGWAWDVQVPCNAHDYCYDLRKAGFSGTVGDDECDSLFWWPMEAHCNNRVLAGDCRLVRDTYFAVSLPFVVTPPDPAAVFVQNTSSGLCMDVAGQGTGNNNPIVQWYCNPSGNQRYKFWPVDGVPGTFQLKPTHTSGMCVDVNIYTSQLAQWQCNPFAQQRFWISGWNYQNIYTLRSQYNSYNWCLDVPQSSSVPGLQLQEYYCYQTQNQRWVLS